MLFLTKPLSGIPSSIVSIFIPDEDNKGKSKHKRPFPFVKVQAKDQNVFICKTTGERVSSDNLFRVRCKQPFAMESLKIGTGAIPATSSSAITAPKANIIDLDTCCSSQGPFSQTTEDDSWLKVGSITLYLDDKQSILMTGSQITVAQSLLKIQFPHFNGLEDTLLLFHEKRKHSLICPETVQILHINGNHWITVSQLGCKNGDDSGNDSEITVHNSIFFCLSKHAEILWLSFFKQSRGLLQ